MVELLHNKHCGGIIASFKSKINEKFGDNTINSSCSGGGISNEGFFGESYDKLLKSCDKIKADDLDGDKLKCKNLSSNKWEYTDNGKYKIGPFSFKFAGTVSKLVVKGIENYTIKDSSGNVIQEEDIKSEKKFYIYASKIQKKNITVKIKVKATTLHAELDIYRSCGEKTEQNILKGSGDKKDIKGEGEATVSIKPDDGKIKIFKTGDEGEPLANAIFAIYKPNGEELQRKWTNGEGIVEFKNLDINPVNKKTTYKVKEIKAPDGYSIRNVSSSPTVTMDEKEVEIEKTNSKGDDDDNTPPDTASEGDTITIFKCDKDTGKPLKGIKFNITIEDTTYETEATGDDGITTFKIDPETHLPAITSLSGETKNTYTATITEVAYNNGEDNDLFGYKPDNTSHTVTIEEIIEKYGEEGTYSDKDSQPSNVYSPKNSIVLYSDDTEDSYTKKHSGKSQGYKVTAKVKYDGEDEYVKCENEKQTGNLIIQKVDSENEGKQLDVEGIRFKITLNEEHWISRKYKSNVIFETTQSDGTITLNDIYVGQYTIEEITDPMSLNKEQGYAYTVTASPQIQAISRQPSDETEAGAEVYIDGNTLKYENEKQKGNLTIKKVDENGNGLAGVKFQIERYGGKYPKSPLSVVCDDDSDLDNGEYKVISEDDDEGIDTFVTNEQGEIKIIDLLQNDGNSAAVYRIREIKIPEDGMGIGDETDKYGYFGHIKSDNVNYGAYEKVSGTNDKYAEVTLSKNSTVTVVAINIKDTVKELNILKVDEDTDNVVLDGVGFKLYAELENKKSGWLRINDEDGPIKQLGYEATSIEIVSEDDATTFETTGGGKISITNVISGKYYAKEMYTHPQYELKQGLIELGELKKDQSYGVM